MKKLKLMAVQSQKEDILRELMLLGCVQIDQPKEVLEAEDDSVRIRKRGVLMEYNSKRTTISNALDRLKKYAPWKKGLLTPLPETGIDEILDESSLEEDLRIAQKILDNDVEIRSITAQENRERATIAAMQPWLSMDQDLSQSKTEYCDIVYATMPAAEVFEDVRAAIADYEADIHLISKDKQTQFVVLMFSRDKEEEVLAELKHFGFAPVVMNGLSGTPVEVVAKCNKELEDLAERKKQAEAAITAEADNRKQLQLGLETLQTKIDREEASIKSMDTASTFTFEGWITAPDEERFAEVLDKYTCAWETEDPDPENPQEVPIKLKNNKVTRPYNMVTEMYSLPAYNGLDPNPFIMPFFAFFFGMMFADMAYGIIMFVAGMVLLKKAKPRGTMRYMAGLLIECGITTFVMGFLIGGFFGDLVTVVGGWFGKDIAIVPDFAHFSIMGNEITLPLNLMSGNNPLYVLIFAIVLGAIHLFVGVLIGSYLKFKDGEWIDAVFNDLCWWVMIVGLIMMVLGKGNMVLYIGIAMMVIGSILTNKGFGKITGIVSAIYNGATGYLGDFLSYSRLMALMLAGSVIASVFNQLGSLGNQNGATIGGTILFIAVFCIGHVLNFILNIIGCFVHTLRLQYLEFFGKWYRDGGKPFRPLNIKTKFFDIAKEEQQ